jgi:pyruvate dehydrogenase E2 component (dihydrolipoyllysine-residue acetyltransferase)
MATRLLMPKLGMEMKEGSAAAWRVKEGDRVERGDVVLEIETEKITYEIQAPVAGILRKVAAREGEVRPIGGLLGVITADGEAFDAGELVVESPPVPERSGQPDLGPQPSVPATAAPDGEERIIATPAAKRLAREQGIDIHTVTAAEPGRRITEKDVRAALEVREKAAIAPVRGSAAVRLGTTIPLTHIRGVIAERLTRSWEAPHVYLAAEIDAGEMVKTREELLPQIERETGQKLSYNDILIRIVALAIEKFPLLNGSFEGDRIRIHEEINIGLAVALEEGLVVPVVRRANQRDLAEIVRLRADLVDKARSGKLELADVQGGTFSISNLGMFEVDSFTAVINPPQSAILSVGRLREVPVVRDGAIAARPVIQLNLGVDHRVIDGAAAAAFLQELKRTLESPHSHLPTGEKVNP